MSNQKITSYMKTHLKHIMFSVIILFIMHSVYAQGQASKNLNTIVGDWEGNITINDSKTVGILWRFEVTDNGTFKGYMGPASKGIATLPMQNIKISDSTLSFSIHSEGVFSGTISEKEITGNWTSGSGKVLPLHMSRELTKKQISNRFENKHQENTIYQSIELADILAVETFINNGYDINTIDDNGFTLLFYAIKNDRTHTVTKYLLNHGANPKLNCQNISPLMYAVAYQNHTAIQELINHKAAVNYINDDTQTALLFAVKGRDTKAIQLLIDHGANPYLKLKGDYTVLDLAKKENIKEVLEALNLSYEGVSDGPYVQESENGRSAVWIHKGNVHIENNIPKTTQSVHYKNMNAILQAGNSKEEKTIEYKRVSKIAAISDIHGQYDTFITLLKNNNILTQEGTWNFGQGHLVVAGDIFDRGPQVTQVLWFLYDLEKQAAKQGGKLHVLLGNHDVMVLNGNLRSVHPKYTEVAAILGKPFHSLFTKETVLGNWLRTRPVVIKINNLLFTHGGLHPDIVAKNLSLQEINKEFKKQLIEHELPKGRTELGRYLHRGDGPIYYRGYFQGERATDTQIDLLLQHFNASNIIVGHTTHRHIETRYNGKVVVIDANMKSGEMAEILLWESDTFIRGNLTGEKLQLK